MRRHRLPPTPDAINAFLTLAEPALAVLEPYLRCLLDHAGHSFTRRTAERARRQLKEAGHTNVRINATGRLERRMGLGHWALDFNHVTAQERYRCWSTKDLNRFLGGELPPFEPAPAGDHEKEKRR